MAYALSDRAIFLKQNPENTKKIMAPDKEIINPLEKNSGSNLNNT